MSLRGAPFSVIARSASDEAISERDSSFHSEQGLPRFAFNDRGELLNNLVN